MGSPKRYQSLLSKKLNRARQRGEHCSKQIREADLRRPGREKGHMKARKFVTRNLEKTRGFAVGKKSAREGLAVIGKAYGKSATRNGAQDSRKKRNASHKPETRGEGVVFQ